MPYVYALRVCLICVPDMYALCVCLICMPYVYALYPDGAVLVGGTGIALTCVPLCLVVT